MSDFGENWLVARPIGYIMVMAIGWASCGGFSLVALRNVGVPDPRIGTAKVHGRPGTSSKERSTAKYYLVRSTN